jgi:hypothetical protein
MSASTSPDGDLPLSAKPDKPAPDPFGGAAGGGPGRGYGGYGAGAAEIDPVATAALICGVLSLVLLCCCGFLVFVLGPAAIGLGLWSVLRIKGDPEHLTGVGMAWAGVGLGAGALVLYTILLVFSLGANLLSAAL